ncbi:MAG: membrane protease YdiL (CAAX protease family) [Clostridium sp.]|jgi:membrane protease YdiL (CAAX protease family)
MKFIKKQSQSKALNYKNIDKNHLKMGFLFGILSFLIILIAYYILRNVIDLQSISEDLQNKSKITASSFIFVGLYITLGNSFLEEYFFRGFIFLNLYEHNSKKFAYIYSSLLFGLYHIGIFKAWFNIELVGLALLGLIAVGFIFNWLDTESENFINSWVVHIFADSAIILIGLRMFGIV